MKKIIAILTTTLMLFSLVGCSSNNVKRDPVLSEDLTKVVEKIYDTAELDKDFVNSLKDYQTLELDDTNTEAYLGNIDAEIKEGICSVPWVNIVPYELVLVRVDENADVEAVKKAIKENANPRKWVCVEAEEVVVENIDNTILFLMAEKDKATAIKEAFMNLAEVK